MLRELDDVSESTFLRRAVTTLTLLVIAAAAFVMAWKAVDVLLLTFLAALFAVFVRTLTDWVSHRTGWKIRWAMLAVLLGLLAIVGFVGWLLAPNAIDQIRAMGARLPEIKARLDQYGWGGIVERVPGMQGLLEGKSDIWGKIGSMFNTGGTFGPFLSLGLVLIIGIYLAAQPQLYRNGVVRLFPPARRRRAATVLDRMGDALRWWLLGQFVGMIFIGIVVTVGLKFMALPLAYTLGIVAGLLAFIPNIGYFISILPALLLAFLRDPVDALYVVFLYTAAHWLNDYLITPMIQRRTVHLPPAATISFQVFLGVLLGGLGLIVATPLLAALLVLIKSVYIRDTLGDEAELP